MNILDSLETKDKLNTNENISIENLDSENTSISDGYHFDTATGEYVKAKYEEKTYAKIGLENINSDIPENEDVVALTTTKDTSVLNIQKIAKTSIRVSLKAFLISLTLTFLNFFT